MHFPQATMQIVHLAEIVFSRTVFTAGGDDFTRDELHIYQEKQLTIEHRKTPRPGCRTRR